MNQYNRSFSEIDSFLIAYACGRRSKFVVSQAHTDNVHILMKPRDYWRKETRKTNDPMTWKANRNLKKS